MFIFDACLHCLPPCHTETGSHFKSKSKNMYRNLRLLLFFLLSAFATHAQVVYSDPAFPTADDEVTIYFDATQGNGGLANCNCDVYLHTGVITNMSSGPSNWLYVPTTWGVANPAWKMTPVSGQNNLYSYTFSPSVRGYFGVPGSETIEKIAFVFRNGNGSLSGRDVNGADIFLDIFQGSMSFTAALQSPTNNALVVESGAAIPVRVAANEVATISVRDNGVLLVEENTQLLQYNLTAGAVGTHIVEITASNGETTRSFDFAYAVPLDIAPANPPAGLEPGIRFENGTLSLSLYAPGKDNVFVLGDFTNWRPDTDFQMTPSNDGNWWIEIGGLEPGSAYAFQYLVDGELRIADPHSTLVLDPNNDPFIPEETYPNLPEYPEKAAGMVTLVDPAVAQYNWQASNYNRPAREELVIYELLLRDFMERHDYTTLIDTLDYLQRLGVNAIELMPVNEFSGNISWGYNPTFHMALDKYYGPMYEFKRFVDACHKRGMAVILDVVFNHVDLPSPLVSLYWNQAAGQPAANNPWLNQAAPHDYSVFFDFNHESPHTRAYIDRVIRYWLTEFRVDGFRFDLSKGLTQNVGGPYDAGAYDASRIAIIKHYADVVWQTTPGAYMILEHFADWAEEKELVEYGQGMMVWNNMNFTSRDIIRGGGGSLNGTSYTNRGWNTPYALISYMESHDEERLIYEALNFGSQSGSYNVRDLATALARAEALTTLFYAVPGPKMLWQFGEVGYDFSINYCEDGTINNGCRTNPKPIRWDYYQESARRGLYEVTSTMARMKAHLDIFNTTDFELDLSPAVKKVKLHSPGLELVAVANLGLTSGQALQVFSSAGTWYEYFTGQTLNVVTPNILLPLAPGEYRLYTNQPIDLPSDTREQARPGFFGLNIAPNPSPGPLSLRYELPQAATVRLEIFNMQGQRAFSQETGLQPAGPHSLELAPLLPAGAYVLKIAAGGLMEAKTFVVGR